MKILKSFYRMALCLWIVSAVSLCQAQREDIAESREAAALAADAQDRFWRDTECGFWIFSATGVLPHTYRVWSATIGKLPTLQFVLPGCEADLTHISRIRLLYEQKIPSASEVASLCQILHQLIWEKGLSPFPESQIMILETPKCRDSFQNASLYDEVLQRLAEDYPSTVIRDIYMEFAFYDVYWW